MKILLDNCVHKAVKTFFPAHQVLTAYQAGLSRLENGDLLSEAAKSFEVLVTTDKNIRNQHNLSLLPLPVIELATIDTRIEGLTLLEPYCEKGLTHIAQFLFVSIHIDGFIEVLAPRRNTKNTDSI